MYQAIEAVCRDGRIVPMEPVQFQEDEHLLIVRLPAPTSGPTPAAAQAADWQQFVGVLQASSNWQGDPQTVQEGIRREWD